MRTATAKRGKMKDISQYINFKKHEGIFPKKSIKFLIDKPCIIHEWKELESRFRDGNPSGRYVQMHVEIDSEHFCVNTGSVIIMEQLDIVSKAKAEAGETEQCFTCVIKRSGRGVKLYPSEWEHNDVCA